MTAAGTRGCGCGAWLNRELGAAVLRRRAAAVRILSDPGGMPVGVRVAAATGVAAGRGAAMGLLQCSTAA